MSKNMQIRFKGGPKDGCVLRVPVYTKVADAISRFAVPLVGNYEVTTRSPAGEHVIVTWAACESDQVPPLPLREKPYQTPMEAWLLSAEAVAWRKSLDEAVSAGVIQSGLRDAMLNPGQLVTLEHLSPTEQWNAALDAAAVFMRRRGLTTMVFDMLKELKK